MCLCSPPGLRLTGWSEGWQPADFELLCPDGSRAPLSDWESCNLGDVPPNTVMTRPVLAARVYDFLMKSQVELQPHQLDEPPMVHNTDTHSTHTKKYLVV